MTEESNINKIKKVIFGTKTNEEWNDKYFNNVINNCINLDFVKKIHKIIGYEICYKEPHYPLHVERRYRITQDRLKALKNEQNKCYKGARENAVERYIMSANGDELCNQWPVGKRQECVDLVYINEDDKYSLIELKIARKSDAKPDSPLLAFVESIKNYCLVENMNKVYCKDFKIAELIILATKTYYQKFITNDKKKFEIFIDMVKTFNKNNNINFKLFYIDVDEEDLISEIIFHEDNKNKEIHKRCLSCVKKENWGEINENNWEFICN